MSGISPSVVEIDHRIDDVVALRRYFLDEVTDGKRRRRDYLWGAAFFAAAALGLAMLSLDWRYNWKQNLALPVLFIPPVMLVTGGVAAYLIYRESGTALMRQAQREVSQSRKTHQFGPRRILFDQIGFRVQADGWEYFLEWRLLPAILRDFDRLYLCEDLSKTNMSAIVVPGRVFLTQVDFDAFCQTVMRTWRAARVDDVLQRDASQEAVRKA